MLAFVKTFNFAKHLKALRWKTPFEAMAHAWTKDPSIFTINPRHLIPDQTHQANVPVYQGAGVQPFLPFRNLAERFFGKLKHFQSRGDGKLSAHGRHRYANLQKNARRETAGELRFTIAFIHRLHYVQHSNLKSARG